MNVVAIEVTKDLAIIIWGDVRKLDHVSRRYSTVQYPLTLEGGASTSSSAAKSVVAGEFIQHY